MAEPAYAELHCHSHFSFLDGASAPDELVERAVELGLSGLAITDHQGLYGAVRFSTAAEAAGIRPVIGIEIELLDGVAPDPGGVVVPARRAWRPGRRPVARAQREPVIEGRPARPRPERTRLPGHRRVAKEDYRGVGEGQRGPHLVLLARNAAGWRSLCRLASRANLAGTKGVPAFTQTLVAEHTEGVIALSGCRHGELARRLRAGDREGAAAVARRYAALFGSTVPGIAGAGFVLELQHHLLPHDDWLAAETARLAAELGLPVVVTNDVHYAYPEGRELQDVLTAIRHGRSLPELRDLRRPDGESWLKSGEELLALPPGDASDPRLAAAWREGVAASMEIASACHVDLAFERYRFPGFPVPKGETPFSHLSTLCWDGARKRYHPLTSAVVNRLAHELDVIERAGLAEFFLICWDLMRFAKERGIPAQGRGSATSSIVSYTLGISRVEPIQHNLLFERFINEGRTSYPDVDIDFSSERREEVIQYVYERYGEEHTAMVCNLVTYRARSAVREVGYALGFPRPLVDRVAKALETYDSVMVRRDLEAEGGFAEFFKRPSEPEPVVPTDARGLTDAMGQLNHARGGRIRTGGAGEVGDGRLPRREDADRGEREGDEAILGEALIDGMGQLNTRVPLVGKVPPWRQPPKPEDPNAPRPFAWLRDAPLGAKAGAGGSGATPASVPTPGERMRQESETAPWGEPGGEPGSTLGPGDERAAFQEGVAGRDSAVMSLLTSHPEAAAGGLTHGSPGSEPIHGAAGDESPGSGPGTAIATPSWNMRSGPAGIQGSVHPKRGADSGQRPGEDEGGPGDSPVSVRWIREGAPSREQERWRDRRPGSRGPAIPVDPESGMPIPARRRYDLPVGGPSVLERPIDRGTLDDGGGPGDESAAARRWARDQAQSPDHRNSVARLEPEAALDPAAHRGSVAHLSDWERWLELCARIDGFPRHLSIHSGGMLVTAGPLIDIAPIERATMPGRVVVQYDKRDVETMKLIKLDLLGLGMLAAIDETLQLIEHDCAVCLDLDRLPETIPEVFDMLQAADTVGVFQVESRAQMQTLPKSRPSSLDDLVVEVAIIRPGPIQGNAVHPYLRRKQGIEPIEYLHPSLEPILRDSMGVILYQEQVMRIAIDVAGFTPAGSDAFRRAMGTWRSEREMEKLHAQFVEGCRHKGLGPGDAEELFRQCAAFASFGFAKSHAAAFARTAYESSFLKLFYPAPFLVGLINAQPMGFYPVEVLVNDTKRHGVSVLPVDVNRSAYRTTTEWVGRPGWALAGGAGDDGSHDGDPGESLPDGCGIEARPAPVRSSACVLPTAAARERWTPDVTPGWAVRLGLHLVKGIGEEQQAHLDAELAHGPYTSLADLVERTGLSEEVVERLIRSGALDSLGQPRRELLWQLREVAGSVKGTVSRGRSDATGRGRVASGASVRAIRGAAGGRAAGRPMDLRLPATEAPTLPALTEPERLGDAYAVVGLDARRQAVGLFRTALDRLGAVSNAALADRPSGPVRLGGLVVTRQHPMTARGTVFLALEDETGMVNVTLWPSTWQRFRSIVRRHALLLVDGELQREGNVVNVIANDVVGLVEATNAVDGPDTPAGVRQLGMAGMRRLG